MSTRKAIKNTIFNWGNLIICTLLSFIQRTYLIRYLGIGILGVNATIVETVNLLSMLEMGVQTSIIYKMYKPIIDGDIERQRELFNLFKIAYRIIGAGILISGLIVAPFVPQIVNSNIELEVVFGAYFLQVIAIVLEYYVTYYKLLFVVYQKQYINNICGIITAIILFIFQLIILKTTKNYLLFLAVHYISILMSWAFYYFISKRECSEVIQKTKSKKSDIKQLMKETKEMLIGQLSGYIYGSTDNVLISYFFGSIITGLISNYRLITMFIRNMLSYFGNAISPTWGDFLYRGNDVQKVKKYYRATVFLEYCLCLVLLVPMVLLIDTFVCKIWLHDEGFAIKPVIYILIALDIFLASLGEPNCIIMRNLGMFKEEKNVSLIVMITNIVSSITLAKIIGVEGIFVGTVIAVFVYLVIRSFVVNNKVFEGNMHNFVMLSIDNLIYTATFIIDILLCYYATCMFSLSNLFIDFVIKGFLIEGITLLYIFIIWGRTERFNIIWEKIWRFLSKKEGKKAIQ